jgi:hypothetical protein
VRLGITSKAGRRDSEGSFKGAIEGWLGLVSDVAGYSATLFDVEVKSWAARCIRQRVR